MDKPSSSDLEEQNIFNNLERLRWVRLKSSTGSSEIPYVKKRSAFLVLRWVTTSENQGP